MLAYGQQSQVIFALIYCMLWSYAPISRSVLYMTIDMIRLIYT